ncbi:NSP1 protein [Rotavirus A]|uniref:NSP1 protein n=1 Tax=Rotavirus A TaxID=28875 RepID=A0A0P0YJT0_9REOV|nr:NSP1 protein [Rotavirus A]
MASFQLRFEYSLLKFSKSLFNSTLKPISYTKQMQWTQPKDKFNKHLWRTFNRSMNHDLPKGNCWTCGLFANVYSCEFCNVNHICESCKTHRTDLCPFVCTHSNRFAHDFIKIDSELNDDTLFSALKPVIDSYYDALSRVNDAAVWRELLTKRRAGMRIHSKSSIAVDFNDCYLPTNIISFRAVTSSGITTYVIFGHYEPARNREQFISYTNLNLRHYKRVFDYINMLNIRLALNRASSFRPMIALDVTPNKQIPFINDQQFIVKCRDDEPLNYGIIMAKSYSSWTVSKPILACLSPRNLLTEMFTAWMLNDKVTLTKVERMHYDFMLKLSMELNWPNRTNKFINFTYFSYYENLLRSISLDLSTIRRIARAAVHMCDHAGLSVNNCMICQDGNDAIRAVIIKSERKLMECCCFHDQSDADLHNIFTLSHKLPHNELLWRTDFDLRAQMLHWSHIAVDVLNFDGLLECMSDMIDFDQDIPERCQLKRTRNDTLPAMQRMWALSNRIWLNSVAKFNFMPELYKTVDNDDDGVVLLENDGEGVMLIDMSAKYKWLASKFSCG